MNKADEINELIEKIDIDIEETGGIEEFNNCPYANEIIVDWIFEIIEIIKRTTSNK